MKRLLRLAETNFLEVEFVISLAATILAIVLTERGEGLSFFLKASEQSRGTVFAALSAVFGSTLGFAITALSIIIGYAENQKLILLKKSPYYHQLWGIFTSAIKALALATLVTLLGLLFNGQDAPSRVIVFGSFFLSLLSLFRTWRVLWVLERIVRIVSGN